MGALTTLAPVAVRIASGTSLSTSQYFGLAIIGADLLSSRLFKVARLLDKIAGQSDAEAAQEMVNRMRADVPTDTGNLFNGIEFFEENGIYTVQASAVHPDRNGGEDYAGFVERGTKSGIRTRKTSYVADSNYHELTAGLGFGGVRPTGRTYRRTRLQYRTHPGTPAQPFFFQNAIDVLRERRANLGEVFGLQAAAEGDFQ